nr:hypothetical protein [Tanacetum cinerariifolium]
MNITNTTLSNSFDVLNIIDNDANVSHSGGVGPKNDSNIRTNNEGDLGAEESGSDMEEVFNKTAEFITPKQSKVDISYKSEGGIEKSILYERWKESYNKDLCDDDPYDDDARAYLTEKQLAFCNALDISLEGQIKR